MDETCRFAETPKCGRRAPRAGWRDVEATRGLPAVVTNAASGRLSRQRFVETARHRFVRIVFFTALMTPIAVPVADAQFTEVAGVLIAAAARVADVDLVLNGAGLRRRFNVNVYAIGLYCPERTDNPSALIDTYRPKRIALTFYREVSAQQLVEALFEGVRENTTDTEFANVKRHADALAAVMLPLRTAARGDTVALDYLPNVGAQVVFNARPIGDPIPSFALYRALLKIWVGPRPVDPQLKRALLAAG
jgi:hypothetical protein